MENRLTERKLQILQLLALGHTQAEIAQRLDIAPGTVKNHISGYKGTGGIVEHFGAKNTVNAVYLATLQGILPVKNGDYESVELPVEGQEPVILLGPVGRIDILADELGYERKGKGFRRRG